MAVELYSEAPSSPLSLSPRISFSHDLSPSDINFPIQERLLRSISSSSPDFDFCNQNTFDQHSVFAEELFSNGKMLPTDQVNTQTSIAKFNTKPQPPTLENTPETQNLSDTHQTEDHKKKSKSSFWQFKRSSSLNSGNGYTRSLCPIPLLSRSNSAGSAPSSKRSKDSSSSSINQIKPHSQKTPLVASKKQYSNSYQKPPLKKKNSYGDGVRINSVLNVPSGNLFGLGSFFSGSTNKEKIRKN